MLRYLLTSLLTSLLTYFLTWGLDVCESYVEFLATIFFKMFVKSLSICNLVTGVALDHMLTTIGGLPSGPDLWWNHTGGGQHPRPSSTGYLKAGYISQRVTLDSVLRYTADNDRRRVMLDGMLRFIRRVTLDGNVRRRVITGGMWVWWRFRGCWNNI